MGYDNQRKERFYDRYNIGEKLGYVLSPLVVPAAILLNAFIRTFELIEKGQELNDKSRASSPKRTLDNKFVPPRSPFG